MDRAIWPLSLLVLVSILLSVSVRGLDDDYDEIPLNSTITSNATNTTLNEKLPLIAKRLNCSKVVLRHKGVKVEETRSDKIFKLPPIQRVAPSTEKPKTTSTTTEKAPVSKYEFTIPPELLTGGTPSGGVGLDLFGVDTDEPDPIAALLAQEEDEDPIAALLNPQSNATNSQQPRHLASGHDKNQLNSGSHEKKPMNSASHEKKQMNSTAGDRQGNQTKSETPAIVDHPSGNLTNSQKNNGTNSTVVPECAYAFDDDGHIIRWYEVMAQNGGLPGEVNATRLKPKKATVLDPCVRPVTNTTPPLQDLLYEYELMEFEKVYRREKAFRRFLGTPSEFVDVIGQLVWSPPGFEGRYFRLYYRKDDTGFYVTIRKRHKCMFEKKPLKVSCHLVQDFSECANNSTLRSLSPGLQASLIG